MKDNNPYIVVISNEVLDAYNFSKLYYGVTFQNFEGLSKTIDDNLGSDLTENELNIYTLDHFLKAISHNEYLAVGKFFLRVNIMDEEN